MPVVPFKSYPLADKGMSWSFSASDGNALIERGGWSLFKSVHTWFDDSEGSTPENKSAYKLPHHKIVDDEVKTVWRGCTAAMARLMQQNTQIPDGDRRGCYRHLSRHYREFDEEPPEFGRYDDDTIADWLARWGYGDEEIEEVLKGEALERAFGKPTPSQLQKINAMAKRPLSTEEVFVFTSKMVGDAMIPERFLKIDKSLLEVFKKDADAGVALLIDHPWAGLVRPKPAYPFGRTFNATLRHKGDIEGETWSLYSDKYVVRGREKDGIKTDEIIADIEDGVFFDTSIGWGADTYECSICGQSIRTCEHWPGEEYDGKLCFVIAKPPGFLMEESLVFDGAYPTAGILSATNTEHASEYVTVTDLKQTGEGVPLLHAYSRHRNRLVTFALKKDLERKALLTVSLGKGDETGMEEHEEEKVEAVPFMTKEQVVGALGKEYDADAVLRLAKEGLQFREELIQDTLEWGIRALGNAFAVDDWKQLLSEPGRTIEAIKNFRQQFKEQTEKAIPAGRVTSPAAGGAPKADTEIPDEAYEA